MNKALSLTERMIHRWLRIKQVLTEAPLGLYDQLEEMLNVVGCDCVILASSLPAVDADGQNSDNWEWTVHRAAPDHYSWLVNTESHINATEFKQLAHTLTLVAKGAQHSMPPNPQTGRLYLFNDWGCESSKLRIQLDKYRTTNNFMLKEKKLPIPIGEGERKHFVTHIGLVLLGSVSIGRWELGESYLVFLDFVDDQDSASSKQWVDTMEIECVPFLAYLAEVDSHFDRLSSINRYRPNERLRRMERMTPIELDAYCRSVNRLIPLLETDLSATIETLIQMQYILEKSDHKLIDQEVAEIKRDTDATLDKLLIFSFPVLEDSRRVVTNLEKTNRVAHLKRQVEWTRIWWKLEVLHHESHRHHEKVFENWSRRLPIVLAEMLNLLDSTQGDAWFCLGKPKTDSLTLNGPCLAGFLVTQILKLCRNRIDPGSNGMNLATDSDSRVLEALTFARKLVCTIRYSLGCVKADEEVLRALLWLLSEIGHDQFGIDRRLDFEHNLCLAAMEQPALYGLKSFYRDHLSHVLQVCMTGWMFLETQYTDTTGKKKRYIDIFGTTGANDKTVLGQWFVASLLHDVGYIIDVGMGWTDLLERFGDPVLMDLSEQAKNSINEWSKKNVNWKYWNYKEEDKPGEDHGIVSALHVHSALENIPDHIPKDYDKALKAIAHHNHHNANIRFETEQLSVLLILCDELQEWDRPWLDFNRAALAISTMVAFGPNQAKKWYKPLSKVNTNLQIDVNPTSPCQVVLSIKSTVFDFTIEYSDDIHRNHTIFNAWLGRTRSLQRIILGADCPLDFRYRLTNQVTPPGVLSSRDTSEPELTRLWRIVRDERVWSIHRWMDQASNGKSTPIIGTLGNQGVTYRIEKNGKSSTEIVTLDVRNLGENRPISDNLKEFWKAIVHWRHAGESIEEQG